MPRGPRLDAPGVLHHVMVRGLDRQRIFRDDRDRADLCRRLAAVVQAAGLTVYAWALLPNHFHLLVRTGDRPLARAMRSLLTGYAGAFNRRHRRTGHLFQNRYKSIVVEEEPYFLELVRYIHLNPLRGGVVWDLPRLDRYPWAGHSALVGRGTVSWQNGGAVLGRFGPSLRRARAAYRAFVADGISRGRRPDLQGGGLVRSAGGWEAVRALRRGRERWAADERVLGTGPFVDRLRREVERAPARDHRARWRAVTVEALVARVCGAARVSAEALAGGGRGRTVTHARDGIAYLWLDVLGRPAPPLAASLGMRAASVYRAAARGRGAAARWGPLLGV